MESRSTTCIVPPQTGQFQSMEECGRSAAGDGLCRYVFCRTLEQAEAERQKRGALPVGEESEVADTHEARWQQVEQETAQELLDIQSHEPLLVAMGGVSPLECDVALGESDQPAVGDGDAMGVGAQIAQHMFRPTERPLGVDDPVMAEQYPQPCCKGTRLGQGQEVAVELDHASMEGAAKSGNELTAEDTAEHADGQKKGAPGGDPAGVIRRQTTGGQYAVDMGMKLQALVPAVEHAEERSRPPDAGDRSDLQQGLGAGMKEQVVNQPLVLQGERASSRGKVKTACT